MENLCGGKYLHFLYLQVNLFFTLKFEFLPQNQLKKKIIFLSKNRLKSRLLHRKNRRKCTSLQIIKHTFASFQKIILLHTQINTTHTY